VEAHWVRYIGFPYKGTRPCMLMLQGNWMDVMRCLTYLSQQGKVR
jgi:hypothetical protein